MTYLILSILCSVAVSVLLKVARRQGIDIRQAIAFNYVMACGLTWFLLAPSLTPTAGHPLPWLLFAILGIILPVLFMIMSRGVEYAGIVRADAAQRLSLFLTVLASFVLFGEALSVNRGLSLALAFAALFCLLWKPADVAAGASVRQGALYLFLIWLGYGVVDMLFKQIAKTGTAFSIGLFVSFVLAGVIMFAYLLIRRTQWNARSILGGLLLGLLNFCNILFYIRAHQTFHENPTLVFTVMNIGVISLGTIVGAILFREKISRINLLGIALAIVAVLTLYYWTVISG
ncbi:EamA family transporter [Advenella mimigardefordensis]|uniref:Putative membrane protein, EamA family n=1 Tax=Advenella mimigardefordensis (strain DSM 17166 / LMG 22922 / DPN7) TaxID=1247726 RepID=W0PHH8_ADVMD|nr:membrane protein [Advenella mimigardefordensis]AHG64905.1 putative membrane protein, EamA family [Advenella mimigardefordensis DPN7]